MFRELFYIQKSDRRVILALLIVIVAGLVAIHFTSSETAQTAAVQAADSTFSREVPPRYGQHYSRNHAHGGGSGYYAQPAVQAERFFFDPNTADSTALLRLGLQPWQVRSIYKYRAAGGVYRKPTDFAKLYGLTLKQYRELEPYIRISDDYRESALMVKVRESDRQDTLRLNRKVSGTERIVLNTADTAALRRVPGIGVFFANEILRYGQRLGGYVSLDQLDDIDGFPQAAKQFLVIDQPSPRKLNVNKLSLNELRRHPYINFYQAKAIVDYRRLFGAIRSLEDLSLSGEFPPEAIHRLEPYIEY